MWLLEKDKAIHLCVGFLLSYIVYIAFMLSVVINPWLCLGISTLISAIVSLLKEVLWDNVMKKGVMNWKDFYAGCIGDAICAIVVGILIFV